MRRRCVAAIAALVVTASVACTAEDPPDAERTTSTSTSTSAVGAPSTTTAAASTSAPPPSAPATTAGPAAPLGDAAAVTIATRADVVATFRPLLVGERTLVLTEEGMASFGPDGTLEWEVEVCPYLQRWGDQLRVVPAPLVTVECNDQFFALSPVDGSIVWKTRISENHFRDAPNDEATVAIENRGDVQVRDLATGAVRFERLLGEGPTRTDVADGLVFVGADDRVVALDAMSGDEVWAVDVDMGLLVADAGLVFVLGSDKTITALDARTGVERWTSAPEPRLQSETLFGVSGGHLVVTTGQDLVLGYDISTGTMAWTFNDEDAGRVSVTPWAGYVLIGRDLQHHIVDAATGTVLRTDGETSGDRVGVAPGRYVDAAYEGLIARSLG